MKFSSDLQMYGNERAGMHSRACSGILIVVRAPSWPPEEHLLHALVWARRGSFLTSLRRLRCQITFSPRLLLRHGNRINLRNSCGGVNFAFLSLCAAQNPSSNLHINSARKKKSEEEESPARIIGEKNWFMDFYSDFSWEVSEEISRSCRSPFVILERS